MNLVTISRFMVKPIKVSFNDYNSIFTHYLMNRENSPYYFDSHLSRLCYWVGETFLFLSLLFLIYFISFPSSQVLLNAFYGLVIKTMTSITRKFISKLIDEDDDYQIVKESLIKGLNIKNKI